MVTMRAKMAVNGVERWENGEGETLLFAAVAKTEGYPEGGTDENNTFARFTPSANLSMGIQNPDLFGKFETGDEFYVDFTPAQ